MFATPHNLPSPHVPPVGFSWAPPPLLFHRSFLQHFTAAGEGGLADLRALLAPLLLRRTISDVPALALPPVSEIVVQCAMSALQRKVSVALC